MLREVSQVSCQMNLLQGSINSRIRLMINKRKISKLILLQEEARARERLHHHLNLILNQKDRQIWHRVQKEKEGLCLR